MSTRIQARRPALRLALTVAALLAAGPALAGCADAGVQDAVNGAVQEATGGDVSLGGTLPDGWPAEIPVIAGEVKFGAGNTTNGDQGWVVTVASESADPLADAKQLLTDAGFESDTSSSANVGDVGVVALTNATWTVVVAGTPTGLLYTVAPA
jgi:hypothetical protein